MNGTRNTLPAPVAARFATKVDSSAGPDACWPWTAFISDTGYGQFWNGERLTKAHRVAYQIANGHEAAGDTDHTCHNGSGCKGGASCTHRACCNPRHLEDVTHRENVKRGEAGKQSAAWKLSCVHGHQYTLGNTYIDPTGHQRCRSCASNRYLNQKRAS